MRWITSGVWGHGASLAPCFLLEGFELVIDLFEHFFVVGVLSYLDGVGVDGDGDAVEDSDFAWVQVEFLSDVDAFGFGCGVVVGNEVSASCFVGGLSVEGDDIFVVAFELLHGSGGVSLVDGDGAGIDEAVTACGP